LKDNKSLLSTLWIFVSVNYIFCDVLSNMDQSVLKELLTGTAGGIAVTPTFLLGAALLMEIPFIMIVLSKLLPYGINRVTNIVAGAFMILTQVGSLFVGTPPTPHYIFFSIVEITGCLAIVLLAAKSRAKIKEASVK
jgi:hypothetical protein